MFEDEKRDKKIFRVVIGVNVICLICLVFYTYNLIFLGFLYEEDTIQDKNESYNRNSSNSSSNSSTKEREAYWVNLAWFLVFLLTLTLISVQTTMDVDMLVWRLGPDEDYATRMKSVRHWITMSTWFLFLAAVAFTSSIFVNPGGRANNNNSSHLPRTRINPLTIFILGFGGLVLRFVLLYMGHRYWHWLKRGGDGGVAADRIMMRHAV